MPRANRALLGPGSPTWPAPASAQIAREQSRPRTGLRRVSSSSRAASSAGSPSPGSTGAGCGTPVRVRRSQSRPRHKSTAARGRVRPAAARVGRVAAATPAPTAAPPSGRRCRTGRHWRAADSPRAVSPQVHRSRLRNPRRAEGALHTEAGLPGGTRSGPRTQVRGLKRQRTASVRTRPPPFDYPPDQEKQHPNDIRLSDQTRQQQTDGRCHVAPANMKIEGDQHAD